MNVLWSFMGSSPAFTVISGVAEVTAGLLLLFRRTATLGALAGAAVMLNVVALNFCYDVPVKLYSGHLFLVAVLLCLPDLGRLWRVFVRNRTTRPRDLSRPRMPYFGHVLRLLIVGPVLVHEVSGVIDGYGTPVVRPPLHGIWDVVSHTEDGVALQPLTTEARRWQALLVETEHGGWRQAMDGSLRLVGLAHDPAAGTLTLTTSAAWSYVVGPAELTLRGEFVRWFRPDPVPPADEAGVAAPVVPEPRDPQLELVLVRAPVAAEPVAPEVPTEPDSSSPSAPDAVAAQSSIPVELVGRWRVSRTDVIGEVTTRRRADPTEFEFVTFGADGSAVVEHAGGAEARYSLSVDMGQRVLRMTSLDTLRVTPGPDDTMDLSGMFRGHEVALQLARRDLRSFLLVRRGFHWINEIPLNRF
jgi:hypothetical protein